LALEHDRHLGGRARLALPERRRSTAPSPGSASSNTASSRARSSEPSMRPAPRSTPTSTPTTTAPTAGSPSAPRARSREPGEIPTDNQSRCGLSTRTGSTPLRSADGAP
jgi:hypothetical protein